MPDTGRETAAPSPAVSMYEYLKMLQSFAEELGGIHKVNMDCPAFGDATRIAFEGRLRNRNAFSIELIIKEEET